MRLKCESAIEVSLVLRDELGAINLPIRGEEIMGASLAQLSDVICSKG